MLRSPRFMLTAVLAVPLYALALTGCPDDHSHADADSGTDEHGHVHEHEHDGGEEHDASHSHETCGLVANCKDTETLAEGLEVKSDGGSFTAKVVEHDALAPEDNRIVFEISDASGKPVEDAEVSVDVFSVDCMHAGPLGPQDVSANAEGLYETAPHPLHGGPWDTTLKITADGTTETATLHLCVPMPGDAG